LTDFDLSDCSYN